MCREVYEARAPSNGKHTEEPGIFAPRPTIHEGVDGAASTMKTIT